VSALITPRVVSGVPYCDDTCTLRRPDGRCSLTRTAAELCKPAVVEMAAALARLRGAR